MLRQEGELLPEGRAGWGWDRLALGLGPGPAPAQLQGQALLAPSHRPTMSGGEERSQHEAPVTKEWLLRQDPPVVGHVDVLAILCERPHARALEVTMGDELEPGRRVRLGHSEVPAQGVGKKSLRV